MIIVIHVLIDCHDGAKVALSLSLCGKVMSSVGENRLEHYVPV